MKTFILLASALLYSSFIFAQNGKITGQIKDNQTNESLIGVVIKVKGSALVTTTDLDGFYSLELPAGTYTLSASYIGYQTKEIDNILVSNNKTISVSFVISEVANQLEEVVIKSDLTEVAKENVESMVLLQKKTTANISTISADMMKKLPDRSAGDAVRRVSGATIQDGKYVIIRGLNERYNMAMMNGLPLASTETDRKAFSFDLVPAAMLDNIIIYKTGTPDLPGDFAGGIVQVTTKDIPEVNTQNLSVGLGANNLTTFKKFETQNGGKWDWLGIDKKYRVIPNGIPSDSKEIENLTNEQNATNTKKWSHNYGSDVTNSMRPSLSFQYSIGRRLNLFKRPLGFFVALSYNNAPSYSSTNTVQLRYPSSSAAYFDQGKYRKNEVYKLQTVASGLFNVSYKPFPKTKISTKNFFNISSDQFVATTVAYAREDPSDSLQANTKTLEKALFFATNRLYTTQLSVEQSIIKDVKLKAIAGYTLINRDIPDYKKYIYYSYKSENEDDGSYFNTPYTFYSNTNSNFSQNTGRFFQKLQENNKNLLADLIVPVKFSNKMKVDFKAGFYYQTRERNVKIRTFAYDVFINAGTLPIDQILVNNNFAPGKISMKERESNYYNSGSSLFAKFVMADFKVTNWLKLVGGLRQEKYIQKLDAYSIYKIDKTDESNVILPYITAINGFTDNDNIKISYFKSVSRPEFREIAPVQFFDYISNIIFEGNPNLPTSKISNYDLKWEHFLKPGEFFSLNLFYKEFKDPIELFVVQAEVPFVKYNNSKSAKVYGIELEGRYKLGKNFTLAGNYTLIKSEIKVQRANINSRTMQGQSPYVINGGINYENIKYTLNASLNFNRFGDRIAFDGQNYESLVFEKGRSVFDFQLSKKLLKERLTLRFILADLLANHLIFYQDINSNSKFDAGKDIEFSKMVMPKSYSFSLSYKFQ